MLTKYLNVIKSLSWWNKVKLKIQPGSFLAHFRPSGNACRTASHYDRACHTGAQQGVCRIWSDTGTLCTVAQVGWFIG